MLDLKSIVLFSGLHFPSYLFDLPSSVQVKDLIKSSLTLSSSSFSSSVSQYCSIKTIRCHSRLPADSAIQPPQLLVQRRSSTLMHERAFHLPSPIHSHSSLLAMLTLLAPSSWIRIFSTNLPMSASACLTLLIVPWI